ncbi:MAG: hypothetical protein GWP45_03625 [Proteobacteria bacterium]|nr:hypothetical protein [Pseudomonadota bacterium]
MNTLISVSKFVIKAFIGIAIAGALFIFAMGFADGPWGVVPGGAFSESAQPAPQDWSFTKDLDTVEVQLIDAVSSRTSWIMEHNNRVFIPSGYMNSTVGKVWKHWPMHAEKNGTALLRIDGKAYRVTLERTKNPELLRPVMGELARKYMSAQPPLDTMLNEVQSNNLWVFELVRR